MDEFAGRDGSEDAGRCPSEIGAGSILGRRRQVVLDRTLQMRSVLIAKRKFDKYLVDGLTGRDPVMANLGLGGGNAGGRLNDS